MSLYLGIDTSNYTTSVALYDSENGEMIQRKQLLPVKKGNLGLRQSDAVFHHTKQLPELVESLCSQRKGTISAIGVSVKPRLVEGSYMPCFLCGEGLARSLSAFTGAEMYTTSHQAGHIFAALFSSQKEEYISSPFLSFHVSGGTTDCLLCLPDKENIINISCVATSLDLKAGQAVDRVGVMLGLQFPCGKELENLALKSDRNYKIKPVLKGMDCSLSGLENKCMKMKNDGESPEDIANYCLTYIYATIREMLACAKKEYGDIPVVFAGGVMSNSIIRNRILSQYDAVFAQPQYSCDNASGLALFARIKKEMVIS